MLWHPASQRVRVRLSARSRVRTNPRKRSLDGTPARTLWDDSVLGRALPHAGAFFHREFGLFPPEMAIWRYRRQRLMQPLGANLCFAFERARAEVCREGG
jgi:hypothetical protein